MSATYFLLLTDHGSTRLAAAQAGTQPFQITHLAIGDANNLPYLPQSRVSEMTLVNEQARVPVQSVAVVGGQVEVVATVDSTVGGFNVHEIGLLDEAGQLLYIGNYHGGYKPILTEGAGGDLELVCVLKTSNLTPVVVEMNPTVVTANRQWVLDNFVRIPTFSTHVAAFNRHVTQNALEHDNLLSLINSVNQRISDLEDIKIGDLYITVINFSDAAAVAAHKGYGTWQRFGNGHSLVAVAHGNNTLAPPQLFDIRDTLSELTVELDTVASQLNIPPCIVIGVWERIT